MKTYRSSSSEETKRFAKRLAKSLVKRGAWSVKRKHALVLALSGELGSGKTIFVQGFLRGLGVRRRSASPTFILFRRFMLRASRFTNVYHVDAYRVKKPRELVALGFKEILDDPQSIVLVEWAENIKKVLPKSTVWLRFAHGGEENKRTVVFKRSP